MDCLFCKIIEGKIPSEKVYEDEKILAFNDINPVAPVHFLIVPKIHADSLNDANENTCGYIMKKIPELAVTQNITAGYRVITNIGDDGGQTVKHLHFHVIGGKKLGVELG